jgi:hypothetical protein
MAGKATQRWELVLRGQRHRVEMEGSLVRTTRWYLDDELVATKRSTRSSLSLATEAAVGQAVGQAVGVSFGVLGDARRVTLFEDDDKMPATELADIGTGGIDLDPEPGSRGARREQRIREHPWRHTVIATLGGLAKVVAPLLAALLVVRVAIEVPWPRWNVPWPEITLPSVPWPDVPWPDVDLPDRLWPAWFRWVADKVSYVWPVLLALGLALAEVSRRRRQDALKAELTDGHDESGDATDSGGQDNPPAS